jgi:hypothetical protein
VRGRGRLVHAVARPFLAVWDTQRWTGGVLTVVVLGWTVAAVWALYVAFAG